MTNVKEFSEDEIYESKIPISDANNDWIRARRLALNGELEKLEEMDTSFVIMVEEQ